jgi:hypothetical protein
MKTTQFVLPAAMSFVIALLPYPSNCRAGSYRSGAAAYRAPGSGTVYGFGSNGQSFAYRQPSGTSNYGQGTRGTAGYGPQYRFDSFTAPRSSRSTRQIPSSQPAFFSGRVWYPRGY